jgi:Protein of unknown function (DUF4038)/Putative Ig domain
VSFSAVGTIGGALASSFSLTPATVGDFILLEVYNYTNNTVTCTGVSSTNVSWTALTDSQSEPNCGTCSRVFIGTVTANSAATVTVSWSGTAPACAVGWQEFSSTNGAASVTLDPGKIAVLDNSSGTVNWPSLTPTNNGELYFGYTGCYAIANGATSGYVYQDDGNGQAMAYNLNCSAGTPTAPVWGTGTTAIAGIVVLVTDIPLTLSVTTTSLPAAATGIAYSKTLAAAAGTAPYTWDISSGAIPTWASLNGSTGAITGTPGAGDIGSTFTARVTDSASPTPATATKSLTIGVNTPVTLVGSVGTASGTSSPLTSVYGQAPTAGNLLVALVSAGSTTAETPGISTAASGWARIPGSPGSLGNNPSGTCYPIVDVWVKTAAGSDAAPTFTQTLGATGTMLTCSMVELHGANTSAPLDGWAIYQSGSATSTVAFSASTAAVASYGEYALSIFTQSRGSTGSLTWTEGGSNWTSIAKLPSGTAYISTQSNRQAGPAAGAALADSGNFSTATTARGAGIVLSIIGTAVTSSATPIGLTESGAGSDSAGMVIPLALTESGAGADLLFVPGFAESGAGADSLGIAIPVAFTESGAGTDLTFIPAFADSGASSDSVSAIATVTLSESGQSSESVMVPGSFTESGTGSDSFGISMSAGLTESGAGSDSLVAAIPADLTESGIGTDALGTAPVTPFTESGAGADSLSAVLPVGLTDSGVSSDSLSATLPVGLTESGASSDTLNTTIPAPLTESGSGSDTLGTVIAVIAFVESGAGSDASGIVIAIPLAITGTGSDAFSSGPSSGACIVRVILDAATGGYFADQAGNPQLYIADWAQGMFTNCGRFSSGNWQADMDNYFTYRAAQGLTVHHDTILNCVDGSAYPATGATWDNVAPFNSGTDPTSGLNPTFWARMDYMLSSARNHNITIAWAIGLSYNWSHFYNGWTTAQFTAFGTAVGSRYPSSTAPNLIWLFGDDDNPGDATAEGNFTSILTALRAAGANQLASVYWEAESTSRFDPGNGNAPATWGITNAQFDAVYGYQVGYWMPEYAYRSVSLGASNLLPCIWSDGPWYTGSPGPIENYYAPTDRQMRQSWWWALTSGSRGFLSDANNVYSATDAAWITNARDDWVFAWNQPYIVSFFKGLTNWYKLVPDLNSTFVTAGRGTHASFSIAQYSGFTDSYVTASFVADGTLAIAYMTNAATITIDPSHLNAGYTAKWVDPVSCVTYTAHEGGGHTYNSGAVDGSKAVLNSQGDPDWLLVWQSSAALSITTASLPDAAVGSAYSQTLVAAGGVPPYEWEIQSGSIPPGLVLS